MRGILVFVLNQRTGVPMAVRAFDTYASKEEGGAMIKFIEELQDGRIVCMAIKVIYIYDYGTYHTVFLTNRELISNGDGDGNENGKKTISFYL